MILSLDLSFQNNKTSRSRGARIRLVRERYQNYGNWKIAITRLYRTHRITKMLTYYAVDVFFIVMYQRLYSTVNDILDWTLIYAILIVYHK